jgi:anthranilate phosphoribosyltransferase
MLGPLVNPSFPKNQLTGVFNLELARLYQYLFQKTSQNFTVLYSLDGYDEISLTGPTKAFSNHSERVLNPSDFGVSALKASEITGGDKVASSAEIFMNVLKNEATEAQQNVVCANAAIAISTIKEISTLDGFEIGKESLRSGKALQALTSLQKLSAL